jgi:uncharacterized membrane protein (DUF373 family)/hemoglobin-like flavoprotein
LEYKDIKEFYEFTEKDKENLKKLKPIMEKYTDEFVESFFSFMSKFPEFNRLINTEEIEKNYKKIVKDWYLSSFEGRYDDLYFARLKKVAEIHVKLGIPPYYINAAANFLRKFVRDVLSREELNEDIRNSYKTSIEKLLNINLDVMTSKYREKELTDYALMSKFEKKLHKLARFFADFIDIVLIIALIVVAFFVIALFSNDIYQLLSGNVSFEKGILGVLGSLLILWAVSELMTEELKHLKGGGFAVGAFIGVALAAMIRKILIASLSSGKVVELLAYGAIVLALGITYWLLTKKPK